MSRSLLWVGGAVGIAVFAAFWGSRLLANPEVALLLPENGAEWILTYDEKGPHGLHGKEDFMAAFRTYVVVEEPLTEAVLHYRAFQFAAIFIDGVAHVQTDTDFSKWKEPYEFDLAPHLPPGRHEIVLSAINRMGPPAVLAYCEELDLSTNAAWMYRTHDMTNWEMVATTRTQQPNAIGTQLPKVSEAVRGALPMFIVIFVVATIAAAALPRFSARRGAGAWYLSSTATCGAIVAALAVLALNNIAKVPVFAGFDVIAHLHYMLFIMRTGAIPVATDGWQMFQSPLYYLVSLPALAALRGVLHPVQVVEALRILPLVCAIAHVCVAFFVMRELFPKRQELQSVGTLVAAMMPINLYMSQNLANEPLAALLTALVILSTLKLAKRFGERGTHWHSILTGILIGLATLAKVTALAMCLPVGLLVAHGIWTKRGSMVPFVRDTAITGVLMVGSLIAVTGWYFAYNWTKLGKPFVGGWDPNRGYTWWQEPGFRTLDQFWKFGEALQVPVFSSVHGFWDGIHSTLWLDGYNSSVVDFEFMPLWNMNLMLSLAWFSLFPAALLLLGLVSVLAGMSHGSKPGLRFCAGCLALYFFAMINLTFHISAFSTIKASYTLGLLSCYGALAAAGFEQIRRIPGTGPLLWGGIIAWAATAYCAHFVL